MAKAPDLSPRALSLVDKLLARLPASVSDLETWWEGQGKVTRLELRRILRQLDGDRLTYDRDAGTVKPMGGKPAAVPPTTMRDVETAAKAVHTMKAPPFAPPRFVLSPKANRAPSAPATTVTEAPTPDPAAPVVVPTVTLPPIPAQTLPASVLDAGILTIGKVTHGTAEPWRNDPSAPVTAIVGGVTMSGSAAAVQEAARAYQRALLSPPTTPRPPAKPRQSRPVTGSVSERVRASVCRKPGTVGEVIGRFPDVNENTIRGALGTLKAKGLVGHTGGKYGAPRG